MKTGKLLDDEFVNKFSEACHKLLTARMPGETSFKLIRIMETVSQQQRRANKARKYIVESYCKRDAEGQTIKKDGEKDMVIIDNKNMPLFLEALNGLCDMDFEVQTLKLEELGEAAKMIEGSVFFALQDIIENPVPKAADLPDIQLNLKPAITQDPENNSGQTAPAPIESNVGTENPSSQT